MSGEREVMTWDELGEGARDLAERIHADGYEPDVVLAIARGGLLVAAALGYALGVKNAYTMNVEFYTGVDERLPAPMILPPVPELVDLAEAKLLIADDVADTGRTLALVRDFCAEGGRGAHRRPLREADLGRGMRLRLALDIGLDHIPLERPAAGHGRARPVRAPRERLI